MVVEEFIMQSCGEIYSDTAELQTWLESSDPTLSLFNVTSIKASDAHLTQSSSFVALQTAKEWLIRFNEREIGGD